MDLPRTLTSGTSTMQRSYLADGTLTSTQDGSQLRIFLGDIVFKVANGGIGIESAGWEGERLLPGAGNDKVLYFVNDHLGSVRTVKDGAGTIRRWYDYYPYGRTVSYGEMIRGMLDSLEDTDPGVVEELDRMVEKHPELLDKLGEYRRENEPDIHGGILGLGDDIDSKILSMAGTISMPTPEELEADPRLKEVCGKS